MSKMPQTLDESPETTSEQLLVKDVLERISADLGMIIDREIQLEAPTISRAEKRAEGEGKIHISFRIGFRTPEGRKQGCILIPLPDALTLSDYLMMMPDDAVKAHREQTTLDGSTKDALLEVGNFVGGASDAVLRGHQPVGYAVRFEGCQGVRADVRPALEYEEGDPLVIVRAKTRIHDLPAFELIMILPELPCFSS